MRKSIQFLLIIILLFVVSGFIIFFFNPLDLRNKMIGSMINYYVQVDSLEKNGKVILPDGSDLDRIMPQSVNGMVEIDKNPLLNAEQEKKLESFGVNVDALPKTITEGMISCFIENLGAKRANEIVAGDTPNLLEIFKTKSCLNK